jgi:hypothetical protein
MRNNSFTLQIVALKLQDLKVNFQLPSKPNCSANLSSAHTSHMMSWYSLLWFSGEASLLCFSVINKMYTSFAVLCCECCVRLKTCIQFIKYSRISFLRRGYVLEYLVANRIVVKEYYLDGLYWDRFKGQTNQSNNFIIYNTCLHYDIQF